MTLSELCKQYQIDENDVFMLYSIACNITKRKQYTDYERLNASIYAVLRREGKLDIRKQIKKNVNMTLLRLLNAYCDKCIDFKTSVKKFVFENFDLTDEQKTIFEKEYDALIERFKNKTLTLVAYVTIACIALLKANARIKIIDFAKKAGVTPEAMRRWSRKLFNNKLVNVCYGRVKE